MSPFIEYKMQRTSSLSFCPTLFLSKAARTSSPQSRVPFRIAGARECGPEGRDRPRRVRRQVRGHRGTTDLTGGGRRTG